MSKYSDLTVAEICNNGVKTILEKKNPSEWTDYDAALAYIFNLKIPQGKMPKELLINSLRTADRYTAIALLKRPEVMEYMEEAVNLVIDRYCSNWVNQYLLGDKLKLYSDPVEESKKSLQWTIFMWLYNQDIPLTWNNMAKFLSLCNTIGKKEAKEMLEYLSSIRNEQIPRDVLNIVDRLS